MSSKPKYIQGASGLKAHQAAEELKAAMKWDADGIPIEDTNMAGVGGEEDKAVRKLAASTEPGWEGIGLEPGLWVFRIEAFKVVAWPREKYGQFHEGDSYIVLQTEFELEEETGALSDKIQYDIHFWLGKHTSTDEKGTAAYKTVELDDFFDGAAVQHRETQGNESQDFCSYFPKGIEYLPGGVESGFKVTQVDIFEARLIQVRHNSNRTIVYEDEQVVLKSLNHRDAFILEKGRDIFVWFGESCSPFLKHAANARAEKMESASNGEKIVANLGDAEGEKADAFWAALGGPGEITAADAVGEEVPVDFGEGVLLEIQIDEERKLTVTEVGRGELSRSQLKPSAVMMVDTRLEIFLWLGKETTKLEKASAFQTASEYLKTNGRNVDKTSITILKDGNDHKSKSWLKMFPLKG